MDDRDIAGGVVHVRGIDRARPVLRRIKRSVERVAGIELRRAPSSQSGVLAELARLRLVPSTIVDAGANDGRSAVPLAHEFPDATIYSLEPASATFDRLVERTAALPGVTCRRIGLGSAAGTAEMYINEEASRNSLHQGFGSGTSSEVVRIMTLDEFMAAERIRTIDLLKVDTEGHDLEVLKGGRQALEEARVRCVQVEVGFGQGAEPRPRLDEFIDFVQSYNLLLVGIYNQCRSPRSPRPAAGGCAALPAILVYADALFVSREVLEDAARQRR